MRYMFEHGEIGCCYDCPMYYDCCMCMLDPRREWCDEDYDAMGSRRPDWCGLVDAPETQHEAGA